MRSIGAWLVVCVGVGGGGCGLLADAADDQPPPDAQVDDGGPAPWLDAPSTLIDAPVDAAPANPGFAPPTAPTRANQQTAGIWMDVGPADWSCLGQPSPDPLITAPFTVTGRVTDYQSSSGVGAATVTAFAMDAPAVGIGTATTANQAATRGEFTMTVTPPAAGARRFGFRITGASIVPTWDLLRLLTPGGSQPITATAVADSTANALAAFVGLTRDFTRALVIGTLVDCQGRRVANAVATVSAAPGAPMHLPRVDSYYFSAGSASLPVRHSQAMATNRDGLFMVLDVPVTSAAYAQVWGFRDAAELAAGSLTLLGEARIVAEANAVDDVPLEPRRAP